MCDVYRAKELAGLDGVDDVFGAVVLVWYIESYELSAHALWSEDVAADVAFGLSSGRLFCF